MKPDPKYAGIESLTVLRNTRVTTLTFGGGECYDYLIEGEIPPGFVKQTRDYPFSYVVEVNPFYTVVQSGCNNHIFVTKDIQFDPAK